MEKSQIIKRQLRFRLIATLLVLVLAGGLYWIARVDRLNSELIEAMQNNDRVAAHRLLNEGADANLTIPLTAQPRNLFDSIQDIVQGKRSPRVHRTRSLLMQAVGTGKPDMVHEFLAHGADVRYTLENGNNALFYSAVHKQADCMNLLLARHADLHARNRSGQTPVHVAAQNGSYACVDLLLDHGADISAQDKAGKTPLAVALSNGYGDVILLLLRRGARLEELKREPQSLMAWAAEEGNLTLLQILWQKYMTPEERKTQAPYSLQAAIYSDKVLTAQFLFDKGVTLKSLPALRSPIMPKVTTRPIAIGGLEPGAGASATLTASNNASYYTISKYNAYLSPLTVAARAANPAMFDLLLRHGASINSADTTGGTPLIVAAQTASLYAILNQNSIRSATFKQTSVGFIPPNLLENENNVLGITKRLLEEGANVHASNRDGITALIAGVNSPKVTRLLLQHGADVNARTAMGRTALMEACEKNQESARLLVTSGANINVQDSQGKTPLMCAASANKPEIVKLLLQKGADPNAKDGKGNTALKMVSAAGTSTVTPEGTLAGQYAAIRAMLKTAGAK